MLTGYIHSIESMGTLDGPGIRTVIFFQGCPLRCKFCHNIDTNIPKQGQQYTVEELCKKVIKNKDYWEQNNGGVTLSGGEPFVQPEFLFEFCKKLKEEKIHLAIDTCIKTEKEHIDKVLPYTDLWMIAIKELNNQKHLELTASENYEILDNIKYIDRKITEKSLNSKIRIRFLVIPTLTDYDELISSLGGFVKSIKNFECLELLAYGTHGKEKWYKIFGKYELEDIREGNTDDLEIVCKKLEPFNLKIKY
jgi:pyruvate formate lyase activating enzyme